jgi:hypothetical protein
VVQVFGGVVEVDLDLVHPAAEAAVPRPVVVADRGGAVVADVSGLVAEKIIGWVAPTPPLAELGTVDEQGDVAPLGQPAAVRGELGADLMLAGRDRLLAVDLEALQAEQVVAMRRPASTTRQSSVRPSSISPLTGRREQIR